MHSTVDAGRRGGERSYCEHLFEASQIVADLLGRQPAQELRERGAYDTFRLVLQLHSHLRTAAARSIEEMHGAAARNLAALEGPPFDSFVGPIDDDLRVPLEGAVAAQPGPPARAFAVGPN